MICHVEDEEEQRKQALSKLCDLINNIYAGNLVLIPCSHFQDQVMHAGLQLPALLLPFFWHSWRVQEVARNLSRLRVCWQILCTRVPTIASPDESSVVRLGHRRKLYSGTRQFIPTVDEAELLFPARSLPCQWLLLGRMLQVFPLKHHSVRKTRFS